MMCGGTLIRSSDVAQTVVVELIEDWLRGQHLRWFWVCIYVRIQNWLESCQGSGRNKRERTTSKAMEEMVENDTRMMRLEKGKSMDQSTTASRENSQKKTPVLVCLNIDSLDRPTPVTMLYY